MLPSAVNCFPIAPWLDNGPPIFSPTLPSWETLGPRPAYILEGRTLTLPSGWNCEPIGPLLSNMEGLPATFQHCQNNISTGPLTSNPLLRALGGILRLIGDGLVRHGVQ